MTITTVACETCGPTERILEPWLSCVNEQILSQIGIHGLAELFRLIGVVLFFNADIYQQIMGRTPEMSSCFLVAKGGSERTKIFNGITITTVNGTLESLGLLQVGLWHGWYMHYVRQQNQMPSTPPSTQVLYGIHSGKNSVKCPICCAASKKQKSGVQVCSNCLYGFLS